MEKTIVGSAIFPLKDGTMTDNFDESKFDASNVALIELPSQVIFPGITIPVSPEEGVICKPLETARKKHEYVGVLLKSMTDTPNQIGCLCRVLSDVKMPEMENHTYLLEGLRLIRVESYEKDPAPHGSVSIIEQTGYDRNDREMDVLVKLLRDDLKKYIDLQDHDLQLSMLAASIIAGDHVYVINMLCALFPMSPSQRYMLLQESDLYERGMKFAAFLGSQIEYAEIRFRLHQQTQANLTAQQREHFLRSQIKTIQAELGETEQIELDELKRKSWQVRMPEEARKVFDREIKRIEHMSDQNIEYTIQRNYLQTLVDLPWNHYTSDPKGTTFARKVLDHDHYGLEKVKERILEQLAVLQMRADKRAPILCLYGPPGVGKTSLGRSIATALKRKYVRIALGGVSDESEVRGHRRTYVGAMPGRIIKGMLRAGSMNPVMVLDEIDKLAASNHGDPSSALLEVLDPEQNNAFHDNYLDIDFDLSKVFFIATANDLGTIPGPLRDRMEIINISGYILEEKVEIGMRHLLPKLKHEHGLDDYKLNIGRKTVSAIVDQYTRESGVRMLERRMAKIMRQLALRIANGATDSCTVKPDDLESYLGKPDYDPDHYEGNDYAGVVTGLAWTSVGGTILMVESALSKGKGEKLTLTGNLGDVMKESAMIAMQWIKSNADYLDIPEEVFEKYSVHIHCPEGAIPKDGPSAGVTMVTSLASVFTQRKVRARIAMTGEITLRGRVTPIGGVKEKILAAKRAGITDLVLCIDNQKDVEEIKPEYRKGLNYHYVRDVRDVIDYALLLEKVKNPKKLL